MDAPRCRAQETGSGRDTIRTDERSLWGLSTIRKVRARLGGTSKREKYLYFYGVPPKPWLLQNDNLIDVFQTIDNTKCHSLMLSGYEYCQNGVDYVYC